MGTTFIKDLDNNLKEVTQLIVAKDVESLRGLLDGSLEDGTNLEGVTSLASYRFNGFTELTALDLTGITEIPNYTANGCTNLVDLVLDPNTTTIDDYAFQNCVKANISELPNTIVDIGSYGFKQFAQDGINGFEFKPIDECSLSSYAFQSSKINNLVGVFSSVGPNALSSCTSLLNVDIDINGGLGSSCFSGDANVLNSNITGVITSLGSSAFQNYGRSRENPESNIFNFDFKNSTFTSIGSSCFEGSSSSPCSYSNIYLPNSLTSVESSAFRYTQNFNVFFKSITPPTIQSNSFSSTQDNNYYVPYNSVNAYRTATNWTSVASDVQGWADGGTFTQGQTLPTINQEGYGLVWYSDVARTTQVTTVNDPTLPLYCSVGVARIAVLFSSLAEYQANCVVSDGVRTYTKDDMIPVDTILTITATTQSGYVPYIFTLNGNTITSGATYTVGQADIDVVCVYWDGVNPPVSPTFADNTPAMIKVGVDTGLGRTMWTIGDTKPITLTNGWTGFIRYTDKQLNRYAKTDGTGSSNAVFEFTSIIQNAPMNPTNTNAGGWAECQMRTITMTDIYDLLPVDWQAVISDVQIPSTAGSKNTTITYSSNKLFLASEIEIFGSRNYSGAGEGTTYDWYVGKSASQRIKKLAGTNTYWWLRSPYISATTGFVLVNSNGNVNGFSASSSYGVSPCFAI